MRPARRLPNGLWRPWAADFLAGLVEQQRLQGLGLRLHLTHDQLAALGQALAQANEGEGEGQAVGDYRTRDPVLSEELNQKLDQVVAQRERDAATIGTSPWPRPAPAPGTADGKGSGQPTPDPVPLFRRKILESSDPTDQDSGRGDTVARQQQQNCGKNGKKDPIKEMVDFEPPDEDWTPA